MCGISGLMTAGQGQPSCAVAAVHAMSQALIHRGPDDAGIWHENDRTVVLGHRRLAIIDRSAAGHQPMVSADGRWVLVYNGEIYNHRVLRADLERAGNRFRGRCDSEVLLTGIAAWGVRDTLTRANGMFAFAVWDRRERALTLARDRLGEKPLYYGINQGQFYFASELKSLRAATGFAARLDTAALALYLRYGRVPSPWSIYQGICKVPPATMVRIETGHGSLQCGEPEPYWTLPVPACDVPADADVGDIAQFDVSECEMRLRESVRSRMEADVPLGAFLSGGIDSSVVAALMQVESSHRVRTFSVGFGSGDYDEAPYARAVAAHLGTEHTEVYLDARQALDVIPALPDLYDEPFADSSQIPTFLISKVAREHVTVCLSGDGGDELFGGYNHYLHGPALWRRLRAVPAPLRALLGRLGQRVPASVLGPIARAAAALIPGSAGLANVDRKLMRVLDVLPARTREDVYFLLVSGFGAGTLCTPRARGVQAWFEAPGGWPDSGDFRAWMMAMDTQTYLPDDILAKVDRASMAVSLEARVPLLDHRLLEYVWRLPAHTRIGHGAGKRMLRAVLSRHVPAALVERPKMGFAVPLAQWLRGPLAGWARSLLAAPDLDCDGLIDASGARRLLEDHITGRRDAAHSLWTVLMLQAWRERWSL